MLSMRIVWQVGHPQFSRLSSCVRPVAHQLVGRTAPDDEPGGSGGGLHALRRALARIGRVLVLVCAAVATALWIERVEGAGASRGWPTRESEPRHFIYINMQSVPKKGVGPVAGSLFQREQKVAGSWPFGS